MSTTQNEKIEQACREAHEKLVKLDPETYKELISKLEFVIASYNYDKNPIGLYEIGELALDALKEYKKEKPRAISKKLVEDIEKALEGQAVLA